MGLGDVRDTTVPKLSLLAPPVDDGAVTTRTFIPHRCHTSIGVLGAAGVAAGLRIAGSVAEGVARLPAHGDLLRIEHPTGFLDIEAGVEAGTDGSPVVRRTAVVRTARRIFDGTVYPRSDRTAPTSAPLRQKPQTTPPLGDIAHVGHAEPWPPSAGSCWSTASPSGCPRLFGPWLGGQLLATGSTTTGFTVFAAAGVLSLVFIGLTGLPSLKGSTGKDTARPLSGAG